MTGDGGKQVPGQPMNGGLPMGTPNTLGAQVFNKQTSVRVGERHGTPVNPYHTDGIGLSRKDYPGVSTIGEV